MIIISKFCSLRPSDTRKKDILRPLKIKQQADDFVVEEAADLAPLERGRYGLYRLRKEHLGTLEAVAAIGRAWDVPRGRIGFCGLKDSHAATTQFITIEQGPPRSLTQRALTLEYLGRSDRPAGPAVLRGNRFAIRVRDLSDEGAISLRRGLEEIGRTGLPNYYDEQRFGSAAGGRFAARAALAGDCEEALKLAIATSVPGEEASRREVRGILARNWGRWDQCARELPRSSERSVVTYLKAHPDRFAHAFELLDTSYRLLLVNAYQSYLWNRSLALWIERSFPSERRILRRIEHWDWPFPTSPTEAEVALWRGRALPMAAPKMEGPDDARAIVLEILAQDGLDPKKLRFKRLRKTFLGRGSRPAWLTLKNLEVKPAEVDGLNPGRTAVSFSLELPKGSYATLVTRRLLGTWKRGRPVY